jgi:hypothetical protein
MFRRWLIRSFFIALCVVCAAVWVGSYFQRVAVHYHGHDHILILGLDCGAIGYINNDIEVGIPYAWQWYRGPTNFQEFRQYYRRTSYHFIGFAFDPKKTDFVTVVMIPLWLPTLLSAVLLWLAWHKTKTRPKATGFPIKPTTNPK